MSDSETESDQLHVSSSSSDDDDDDDATGLVLGSDTFDEQNTSTSRTYGNITVAVIKAKITDEKTDVIVNSTSKDLDLSQGAASRVLLEKGGVGIQLECRSKYPNGIKVGDVAVTQAGSLQCTQLYHVVLPKWDGGRSKKVLQKIVLHCLKKASDAGLESIAFPALGTGNLGYERSDVAKTMFSAVKKFSRNISDSSVATVRFVIFPADVASYQAFTTACSRRSSGAVSSDTLKFDDFCIKTPDDSDEEREVLSEENSDTDSKSECSTNVKHIAVNIKSGQLHQQQTDVVMTTSTRGLDLSKGTLSNSVLVAAGTVLQDECKRKYPKGIQHGNIAVLEPGDLECKNVYCGALPRFDKPEPGTDPKQILSTLMKKCLEQAESDDMASISFPTLGTGYLMYPSDVSADIMLKAISDFADANTDSSLRTVVIVVHSKSSTINKNLQPFKAACDSYTKSAQQNRIPKPTPRQSIVKTTQRNRFVKPPSQRNTEQGKGAEDIRGRLRNVLALHEPALPQRKGMVPTPFAQVFGQPPPLPRLKEKSVQQEVGPARGTPEFCINMYSQEIVPPPYWTNFTSAKNIKEWKVAQSKDYYRLVDVDQASFKVVESLVLGTWEPAKIGHGRDAQGLGELGFKSLKVTKVQRIENLNLYEQYVQKRQQLFHKAGEDGIFTKLSKLPGVQFGDSKIEKSLNREWKSTLYSEVNEGFFFHGTKAERVQGVIKQGLDARMAQGEAVFGQALYMAESSTKADQYTDPRGPRARNGLQMFIVRACLGDICLMTETKRLRRPPCCDSDCRDDGCNHDKRHDSVVEEGKFIFREFVVYDSHQVYPEYVITYDRV